MKIGILRETKFPPDRRTPLLPLQCRELMDRYPGLKICVQPAADRCCPDRDYMGLGIPLQEDLSDCDLLLGIKEVRISALLPGKAYLFFSHTAKKQKHNRGMLQEIISRKIKLIDYEYLTGEDNLRIIAFGYWAGFVGAYNAFRAIGLRSGNFNLKPAWMCKDRHEVLKKLKEIDISDERIVITGGGRVANGAMELIKHTGYKKVGPEEFLASHSPGVYTQLDPEHYLKTRDHSAFNTDEFYRNPVGYENNFLRFARSADIFIACHYWDPRSPVLLTTEDYLDPEFRVRIIADVSCDVGGPIPSTLRASPIDSPFYGYNPKTGKECDPLDIDCITVMSVDNLPGELPVDASEDFGKKLSEQIIPAFLEKNIPPMITRAVIAENGKLTDQFKYLQGFLEGRE